MIYFIEHYKTDFIDQIDAILVQIAWEIEEIRLYFFHPNTEIHCFTLVSFTENCHANFTDQNNVALIEKE